MKKFFSLFIVVTILVSYQPTVFGTTIETEKGNQISVTTLSDNSLLMKDNKTGTSAVLNIQENENTMKVSVKESNNTENYITWDKKTDKIYSSYTGITSNVSDLKMDDASLLASSSKTKTYRISYEKLSHYVDKTASSLDIASALLLVVAAVAGVSIASGPAAVVTLISGIIAAIGIGLGLKDPGTGLYVTLGEKVRSKYQGSHKFTYVTWEVLSVGTY